MAVRNIKTITPKIWIPPLYSAAFKITVERSDGTIDDITDICKYKFEDGVITPSAVLIGSFDFTIPNGNQAYSGVWNGMEIVRYYSDYSTAAPTTLKFRGRIEKISYKENNIKANGRSDALFLVEINVTKNYIDVDCADVLRDMFDSYGEGRFDTTDTSKFPASTGITITVNWVEKPFTDAWKDLCTATGNVGFIDPTLDVNFNTQGATTNTEDAIVHDHNLLEVGDFADDIQQVRNYFRIYGALQDGVQILYTASDPDSIALYGKRVRKEQSDDILTEQQAQEYGDYLLDNEKDPPKVGEVSSLLLASIQQNEKLRISAPIDNIPPAAYTIISYKHEFDWESPPKTTVTVERDAKQLSSFLKRRVEVENQQSNSTLNVEDLDFSRIFLYNVDEGSHNDTQIAAGVLIPTSSSGQWTGPATALDSNVGNVYLVASGSGLDTITFEVSGNNGVSYETCTLKTLRTISTAAGASLRPRITFSNTTARVDSLGIFYTITS